MALESALESATDSTTLTSTHPVAPPFPAAAADNPGFATGLIRSARSELIRLRRSWKTPLTAVALSVVATFFAYSGDGIGPGRGGDAGATSTAGGATEAAGSALAAADGIVAGLDVAGTLIALIALVLWALSVSRDLSTGSIRVLLVTDARRAAYLGGKIVSLAAATVLMCVAAVAVSVGVAYAVAGPNDISTAAWSLSEVWPALANVTMAALLWGAMGGMLSVITRSAAGAIAGGIGYMLLGETLLSSIWSNASDWLPSGTVDNLLAGGSDAVAYSRSLTMTVLYILASIVLAIVVLSRRDVTD